MARTFWCGLFLCSVLKEPWYATHRTTTDYKLQATQYNTHDDLHLVLVLC